MTLQSIREAGYSAFEGGIMEENGKEQYLEELFNFSAVLRGHVKDIEEVKEYIVETYIRTGKLKLIRPTYDKRPLYILTEEEWEEYQNLLKIQSEGYW